MWRKFEPKLKEVYWRKRVFWTGAYFVASCGGVTIDVLRKYVQEQDAPPQDPVPNSSRRTKAHSSPHVRASLLREER